MKKALLLLLSVLFLAGCGKTNKIRIGISVPSATHGWTGGVVWNAEKAKKDIEAKNADVEVIIATSENAQKQVEAIENLTMQGLDALVVLSQEPEPLQDACRKAKESGAFLAIVSNPIPEVQDLFVNGSNGSFGSAAGEAMGQALNGKGDIVVLEGVLNPINTERVENFKKVLAGKYPEIRILESQPSDWNTEKGLKIMENFLQKYPKIDGVWAGDDDVLLGVLKAYEESKRSDVQAFVGGGGSKIIVEKVLKKESNVKATVTYPPQMIAVGAELALKALRNGRKVEQKEVIIPSEIVTPENAKDYYFPDSVY